MPTRPPDRETWAPNVLVPGTKYRIIRCLGEGGMGRVYEVENDTTRTRHALKALARKFSGRADLAWRLLEEARAAARLGDHDHLVKVTDAGNTADGRVFFVMELLRGASLRDRLRRWQASPEGPPEGLGPWALGVALQVLAALDAAHAHGIIHRDIKPDNIFLCHDGPVKLLDFGVAKCLGEGDGRRDYETAPGEFFGTTLYAAPECLERAPFDGRADLYSLGVTLWEVLAGFHPFAGQRDVQIAAQIILHGLPPLTAKIAGRDVPPAVGDLVRRATALAPADRFPTAKAFAAAVLEALARLAPAPGPLTLPAPREPSLSVFLRSTGVEAHLGLATAGPPPSNDPSAPAAALSFAGEDTTDVEGAPAVTGGPTARSSGRVSPVAPASPAGLRTKLLTRRLVFSPATAALTVLGVFTLGATGTAALIRGERAARPRAGGANASTSGDGSILRSADVGAGGKGVVDNQATAITPEATSTIGGSVAPPAASAEGAPTVPAMNATPPPGAGPRPPEGAAATPLVPSVAPVAPATAAPGGVAGPPPAPPLAPATAAPGGAAGPPPAPPIAPATAAGARAAPVRKSAKPAKRLATPPSSKVPRQLPPIE
jgi:serine/threonine protein kinase